MSNFQTGSNYFCDAASGYVLHVSERSGRFVRCFVLDLSAINGYGLKPVHEPVILDVERAAISGCEFITIIINRLHLTFFASERCRAFTLADFRDNFVNYSAF